MEEDLGEIYFKGGLGLSNDSMKESLSLSNYTYIHEGILEDILCVGIVQKEESPKQIIYTIQSSFWSKGDDAMKSGTPPCSK